MRPVFWLLARRHPGLELQDYTTKTLAQKYWEEEQEEHGNLEELAYVPSAADEPRWALHMCDNKCRAKGVMFHELAAVVTIEGGSPQTINRAGIAGIKDCWRGEGDWDLGRSGRK